MNIRLALNKLLASRHFSLLEDKLDEDTIFNILKVQKREISHSAFVAWLLDPKESHGMAYKPLKNFLIHSCDIVMRAIENNEVNKEYDPIDIIAIDKLDMNSVIVDTEYVIDNGRRIDILVSILDNEDNRIPILIIEYKVESKENGEQTKYYSQWAKENPKYLDKYEPLHIYLIPANDESSSPHHPFVVMNYDSFDYWIDHLHNFEKTNQAQFLISEFRTCLQRSQYMYDLEMESLVEQIKEKYQKEISLLQELKLSDLEDDIKNSIRIHQKTLDMLDISYTNSKVSKGESEFIKFCKNILSKELDKEVWAFNNLNGCIGIKNKKFTNVLSSVNPQLSKKLRFHYWMERPKNGRSLLKIEIVGGSKGCQSVRVNLADALRKYLSKEQGIDIQENVGVIARITLNVGAIKDLENDTLENVSKYKDNIEGLLVKFVNYMNSDIIDTWINNDLVNIAQSFID